MAMTPVANRAAIAINNMSQLLRHNAEDSELLSMQAQRAYLQFECLTGRKLDLEG